MKKMMIVLIWLVFILVPLKANDSDIIELDIEAVFYDIQSDNNNTVHIIWGDKYRTWYGHLVNDEVINQESVGVSGVNPSKMRPRLAVRPDGAEAHFVWVSPRNGPNKIEHCYRDFGDTNGEWKHEIVYTTGSHFQYPTIGVDLDGFIHLLFCKYGNSPAIPVSYARKTSFNGEWEFMGLLTDPEIKHLWPMLYVDYQGTVHATWSVNKLRLAYCSAPSGGNLLESNVVFLPAIHSKNLESEIYVDREDNVHLVSLSFEPPATMCHVDHFIKTLTQGNFSPPTHASIDLFPVQVNKIYPTVGAFSKDEVYVCWAQEVTLGDVRNIRMTRLVDAEWVLEKLDNNAELHEEDGKPAVATTSSTVYIIWRHNNGKLWLFKESNCEVFPPENATVERIESQSLFKKYYVDKLSWEANPENENLNIVSYRIYKKSGEGNQLIGEVGADIFNFGYGPIEEGQTVNYAIVAVRDDGVEGCEASPAPANN